MDFKKWLGVCAAALVCGPVFAADAAKDAPVSAPAKEGTYYGGQDCCNGAGAPREVPFEEGKVPMKPCKDNFWCLITRPAVFKCETEQIETAKATFYMKPIPAVYEWVEEQIMVAPARKIPYCQPAKFEQKCVEVVTAPAHKQLEIVPAVFECVNETITFRPALEKEISIPAQYKTVMKTIEVEPERDTLCGIATPTDVKLNCGEGVAGSIGAVHKPARCITIAIQEEVAPATTKKISVPAITKVVPTQKLKTPATTREVLVPEVKTKMWVETCVAEECIKYHDVPAEYKTIRKMVVKEPARTEKVDVPAKFQCVKKSVLVTPVTMVWRQYSISKCKAVSDVCSRYGSLPGSGAF